MGFYVKTDKQAGLAINEKTTDDLDFPQYYYGAEDLRIYTNRVINGKSMP
jgi:hypothetical protein